MGHSIIDALLAMRVGWHIGHSATMEQCLVASAVIGNQINNKQTGFMLARSIDAFNLA